MTPTGARALACFLFLSGTPGCGAVERVRQCREVVDAVNAGVSELHLQVPDAGVSASAYARIARGYEALGKRLDELSPTDTALAKALASYRELTERAAKNSRAYSEALRTPASSRKQRSDKEARLNRIRSQAQADVSREAQVVRKLNAVCHPQ